MKFLKLSLLALALFYIAAGISVLFFVLSAIFIEFRYVNFKKNALMIAWGAIFTAVLLVVSSKFIFYTNQVETFFGKEYLHYS